jgi:hypothetical protein
LSASQGEAVGSFFIMVGNICTGDPLGYARGHLDIQTKAFPGFEHWQTTCGENRMKKPEDRGQRTYSTVSTREKGGGSASAGQCGDNQGLSDVAEAGAESVEELAEEGQSFEAEAIGGVEDAPDADVAEVHTRQVPEDDVPAEYLEGD